MEITALKANTYKGSYFRVKKTENSFANQSFCKRIDAFEEVVPKSVLTELKKQKLIQRLKLNFLDISKYDLEKINGIQNGLKSFDGMSLKEIIFSVKNLYSLAVSRGCKGGCKYCYAEAKPQMQSMMYEDYMNLMNDFEKLKERLGLDPFYSDGRRSSNALFYDADSAYLVLNDKNGTPHYFPELAKKLADVTGNKTIFDTAGWTPESSIMQKRMDNIVDYYRNDSNIEDLNQFNLSINPFHSIYAKSIELEKAGKIESSQKLYKRYVNQIANALFTFTPLIEKENFNAIIRAFDNDVPNMEGYREKDLKKLINDVMDRLKFLYTEDLNSQKKHIKYSYQIEKNLLKYEAKLFSGDYVETDLLDTKRAINLLKRNNPNITDEEITEIFENREFRDKNYKRLTNIRKNDLTKNEKILDCYDKVIDINGRVYLFDNHRIIETDIKFNLPKADIEYAPPEPLAKDYKFRKDLL